jgi:hypothetical protein
MRESAWFWVWAVLSMAFLTGLVLLLQRVWREVEQTLPERVVVVYTVGSLDYPFYRMQAAGVSQFLPWVKMQLLISDGALPIIPPGVETLVWTNDPVSLVYRDAVFVNILNLIAQKWPDSNTQPTHVLFLGDNVIPTARTGLGDLFSRDAPRIFNALCQEAERHWYERLGVWRPPLPTAVAPLSLWKYRNPDHWLWELLTTYGGVLRPDLHTPLFWHSLHPEANQAQLKSLRAFTPMFITLHYDAEGAGQLYEALAAWFRVTV